MTRVGLTAILAALVALLAVESVTQVRFAAFRRPHPFARLPWRIVAHMLVVSALELGDPVPLFILMEADYAAIHP